MSTIATRHLLSLPEVNAMEGETFVTTFGPLFEHSPWIARETWSQRPFASRDDLLDRLLAALRRAPLEKKVALIAAHPDLAGRLARSGQLTKESSEEQSSAGLDRLASDEARKFEDYNQRYREKFGFPFVICARLNDKKTIFDAFERRLKLSREAEIETALGEIEKIARLRLESLVVA
jgi:2-oxo-4-hydroxy-4-carboxy-5-ureidoimidazoline decarboxylase